MAKRFLLLGGLLVSLLAIILVSMHESAKQRDQSGLMQKYVKLVRALWPDGKSVLSQKHRRNLESAINRHKYIRSQLKNKSMQNRQESGARPARQSPTILYSGPRRIRGYVGGPSKPAGTPHFSTNGADVCAACNDDVFQLLVKWQSTCQIIFERSDPPRLLVHLL